MTDRDRLIEIMQDWGTENTDSFAFESVADYLLANGVIVAPMPMAEWLRKELTEHVHERCMEEL